MANSNKQLSPAEQQLKDYLDNYAANDPIFALKYMSSGKTLAGCVAFVTKQAQKAATGSRSYFASDNEVFGWAVHYFDEDSINEEKSKPVADVVTSRAPKKKQVQDKAAQTEKKPEPKAATPKKAVSKPAPKVAPKTEEPVLFEFDIWKDMTF